MAKAELRQSDTVNHAGAVTAVLSNNTHHNSNVALGLARSLQSTCESMYLYHTLGDIGDESLMGAYVEDGALTVNGKPVFYANNSRGIIYWTNITSARRWLREDDKQQENATFKTVKRSGGNFTLESDETPRVITPLTFKAKETGVEPAYDCLSGAWVVAPANGSFPAYAVDSVTVRVAFNKHT